MMFRDNLKSKQSAIDETEVAQVLHRVKMILNNKKYINEVKNMLPHNQNANNINHLSFSIAQLLNHIF